MSNHQKMDLLPQKLIYFMKQIFVVICGLLSCVGVYTQTLSNHGNRFEQLGPLLPSPNEYRAADGAPGPRYWQQRCDYDIVCELNDDKHSLSGKEKITYFNNSPRTLTYLWFQLDENQHHPKNSSLRTDESSIKPLMTEREVKFLDRREELKDKGMHIISITGSDNKNLVYTINETMMRVELPTPLKPGQQFMMKISWNYNMVERISSKAPNARGGYELFEEGNSLYTVSQWYPRLCVYSDFQGWQNHQFTGGGEFALTFGNFKVSMTVPADHIVGATGECQNYQQLLSPLQWNRLTKANKSSEPIEIVTLDEAKKTIKQQNSLKKTWTFLASNVRDFAWTSSRRFIWDAMVTYVEGKKVMCMSYYSPEAYPIYSKFSTKLTAHTINTYSKYTIPYPYPVAQSVEGNAGMEYPMIAFNPGRAEEDGTYTAAARNGAIGTTIHEVGHNFFPMIVNSDERQWSWMDEGLNSFVQFLTEKEYDPKFPSRRGPAYTMVNYMSLPKNQLEPIMTNSENIIGFGSNAYGKPAAGLNILRETIMGRELFDYAFKEYAKRWAFKHPTPADFFRTMEDASAVDLDWFWRGWFYSIDAVDISLDSLRWYQVDLTPIKSEMFKLRYRAQPPLEDISQQKNKVQGMIPLIAKDPSLKDWYTDYEPWNTNDSVLYFTTITNADAPDPETKQKIYGKKHYYQLYCSNKGGMLMPLILEWTYSDGTKEIERIPAEIWRKNEEKIVKVFIKDKPVLSVKQDPYRETADINEGNNTLGPNQSSPSRFQIYRSDKSDLKNPMQRAQQ